MEGKIVLIKFPQDEQGKTRPALVLRSFPKYGDVLLCGISSKTYQYIEGFDLLLDQNSPDFSMSGLKTSGVCRLNFLTMVSEKEILGAIGSVSDNSHYRLLKNLADYLININQ